MRLVTCSRRHLTHAAHHIKVSRDEVFPALTSVNILLLDVEGFTNREQLLRPKDSTIIRDELLRRSKPLNRRIQDNQDTREILALKKIARENGSREGVHDGDHIKRACDLRNAMFFDVANINTPSLMTRSGASTDEASAYVAPPVSAGWHRADDFLP